jgi:DNA adenine methylase
MSQPLLRWAGSKRRLLPTLRQFWSKEFERYVEPFAGSACLFFALAPDKALISDINPHLVRTYKAVAANPLDVYDVYRKLPRTKEYYYSIRKSAFESADETLVAAHFLYLNRNCFNGLYRTNLKGEFNVPFSQSRTGDILKPDLFVSASEMFSKVEIVCADFAEVIENMTQDGDFVYLDPPYAIRNSRSFTQYGPDIFTPNDLSRLKDCLLQLDLKGIPFLLSYADCPEARETFAGWRMAEATVQRNISGFAAHRKLSNELLVKGHWLNDSLGLAL